MNKDDTQGILEARIRQMADHNYSDDGFSFDDFDPTPTEEDTKAVLPIKEKTVRKPRKRNMDILESGLENENNHLTDADGYEKRFFANRTYNSRVSFSMNRTTLDILRKVLRDMESNATLSSFIENILLDHLHTYRELINEATADKLRKPTIPNI